MDNTCQHCLRGMDHKDQQINVKSLASFLGGKSSSISGRLVKANIHSTVLGLWLTLKPPMDCSVEGSRWFLRSVDAPYRPRCRIHTGCHGREQTFPKRKELRGSSLKVMGRKFSEMKRGFWLVKAEVGTGLSGTSWKCCGCSHFRCWQQLSGETVRGGGWERKPSNSPRAWLQEHSSDSTKTTVRIQPRPQTSRLSASILFPLSFCYCLGVKKNLNWRDLL